MAGLGIVGIALIILNIVVSYKGLTNHSFLNDYKFEIDRILIYKEYKRLITSGFLHVSWTHLFFNMLSLLAFSGLLENQLGSVGFYISLSHKFNRRKSACHRCPSFSW